MHHDKINATRDQLLKNRNYYLNTPYVRATGSIVLSLSAAKVPPPHTPVVSYLH